MIDGKEYIINKKLDSFMGHFYHIETQSINWDFELNPLNHNISLQLKDLYEDAEDISNEIGYMGTFFHRPSFWIINTFNIANNGKSAMINMIMLYEEEGIYSKDVPSLAHCNIKLTLDEYNNIIATFDSGTYAPWIMGTKENPYPVKFSRLN